MFYLKLRSYLQLLSADLKPADFVFKLSGAAPQRAAEGCLHAYPPVVQSFSDWFDAAGRSVESDSVH